MTTEHLTLLLAVATVFLTILGAVIAFQTLRYMRRRDLKVDTRNAWIELHKTMVDVRAKRAVAMVQVGQQGAHSGSGPSSFVELQKDYALAVDQLRGQLDRLNDDHLLVEISGFLKGDNKPTAYWQTPEYAATFDSFCHKVALKSRPV